MPAKAEDSSFAHSMKSYDARDDDLAGDLDVFSHADNDKVVLADLSAHHHVHPSHSSLDYGDGGDDLDTFDVGYGDDWDPYDGYDGDIGDPYDGYDDGDWRDPYDGYDGDDFSWGDPFDGYDGDYGDPYDGL